MGDADGTGIDVGGPEYELAVPRTSVPAPVFVRPEEPASVVVEMRAVALVLTEIAPPESVREDPCSTVSPRRNESVLAVTLLERVIAALIGESWPARKMASELLTHAPVGESPSDAVLHFASFQLPLEMAPEPGAVELASQ